MAEFIMKDLVNKRGLDWYIESCATSREEIGNDMSSSAKRCLSKHGVPYEKRSARRMEFTDYYYFDMIIAMDRWNVRNIMDLIGSDTDGKVSMMMSHCGEDRDVDDPWYTGDYETAYADISRGCESLMDELLRGS